MLTNDYVQSTTQCTLIHIVFGMFPAWTVLSIGEQTTLPNYILHKNHLEYGVLCVLALLQLLTWTYGKQHKIGDQ